MVTDALLMPPVTPPGEESCRGRAGRSKPHKHHGGRMVQSYDSTSGVVYVTRCTSCEKHVWCRQYEGYTVVPPEAVPSVALVLFEMMG